MSDGLRARIESRAAEFGYRLESSQAEQLATYLQLLARWNGRMNLTALPLDGFPEPTLDRLIMEPLAAAAHLETASLTWFDFGTGGGSPALPLKIVRPAARLTMVESRARKCAFLREAVRQLRLASAGVSSSRVEEIEAEADSADLITLRALRLDNTISQQAQKLLKPGGRLVTFGPTLEPEPPPHGFRYLSSFPLPTGTSALHWYRRD